MAGQNYSNQKTLCITFDNLGEAAEIELGLLPPDTPTGNHISASVMPRILEVLKEHDVRATFFFEGWNTQFYPEILSDVVEGGHELAIHGWRHEDWANVDPAREEELIDRSFNAFRELGFDPVGFRPPGGGITSRTEELLAQQGVIHISPAMNTRLQTDDLTNIPFQWEDVDAFWFEPLMAPLRKIVLGEQRGDVAQLSVWSKILGKHLDPQNHPNATKAIIFHPYMLAQDGNRMQLFESFIRDLANQDEVKTARCAQIARQ